VEQILLQKAMWSLLEQVQGKTPPTMPQRNEVLFADKDLDL
jgi:hypothetical protein